MVRNRYLHAICGIRMVQACLTSHSGKALIRPTTSLGHRTNRLHFRGVTSLLFASHGIGTGFAS